MCGVEMQYFLLDQEILEETKTIKLSTLTGMFEIKQDNKNSM